MLQFMSMNFTAYILECADKTLYIGATNDIEKRVHRHNHLKSGARYTKARRPVKVVYQETFSTFNEALKREYSLKQLTRSEKLALIESHDRVNI